MSIFWTTTGDDWIKKRNAYITPQIGTKPSQAYTGNLMDNPYALDPYMAADTQWEKQWAAKEEEWFASLPPADRQAAYDAFAARNASFDKSFKIGKMLSLSIIGAAAGGAALTAAGVIGEGAAVAATAGEAATTGGAVTAGEVATGAAPLWDTGVGGLFGSQASVDAALTSAGWYAPGTVAGGIGSTSAGFLGDLLPAGYTSPLTGTAADLLGPTMSTGTRAPPVGGGGGPSVVDGLTGLVKDLGGVGSIIETGLGVAGAVAGAIATKNQAEEDQATARYNAQEAEAAAQNALLRGEEQARDVRRQGSLIEGQQRATFAGRGVNLGVGTPASVVAQTNFFSTEDQATARSNAATEAATYRRQGERYQAQGAAINPGLSTGLSLVSNLGQVAAKWYRNNSSGP